MNNYLKLSWAILFLLASCKNRHYNHTRISFQMGWKFAMGDNPAWLEPGYDDSKWQTVSLGTGSPPLELKNHPGYACYRATIFIPSGLRENAYFPDSVKISLGAIDDCDQVYLNGSLIGQDNSTIFLGSPAKTPFESAQGLWHTRRRYVLPVSDKRILWDRRNVLAIRVFNQYGDGGMYNGIPAVSMLGLEDQLVFEKNNFYKIQDNYWVDKNIVVRNISRQLMIRGKVAIQSTNGPSNAISYASVWDIALMPGQSKAIQVNLPVSTDPVNVSFTFTDEATQLEVNDLDSLPYVLAKTE